MAKTKRVKKPRKTPKKTIAKRKTTKSATSKRKTVKSRVKDATSGGLGFLPGVPTPIQTGEGWSWSDVKSGAKKVGKAVAAAGAAAATAALARKAMGVSGSTVDGQPFSQSWAQDASQAWREQHPGIPQRHNSRAQKILREAAKTAYTNRFHGETDDGWQMVGKGLSGIQNSFNSPYAAKNRVKGHMSSVGGGGFDEDVRGLPKNMEKTEEPDDVDDLMAADPYKVEEASTPYVGLTLLAAATARGIQQLYQQGFQPPAAAAVGAAGLVPNQGVWANQQFAPNAFGPIGPTFNDLMTRGDAGGGDIYGRPTRPYRSLGSGGDVER